jgi:hypothetical protein
MKSNRVGAVVLSVILAMGGMLARAQADGPSQSVPVVPEDQQATKDQLARLFEVMRIKQQMAAMTRNMPVLLQQQFEQQVE